MRLESLFYQVIGKDRKLYHWPMFWVLWLVSITYSFIQRLRACAYRMGLMKARRLPVPVVSVGNLTLGGTGKTPMVLWVAQTLLQHGRKPAILSRGYGSEAPDEINIVSDGNRVLLDTHEAGDEPAMMARRLPQVPILTGAVRYRLGLHALDNLNVDCFVLDDAYQHLPLARDFNLLLLDSSHPFGNGNVFPAGELREPISAIERAQFVVMTRSGSEVSSEVKTKIGSLPQARTRFIPAGLVTGGSDQVEALSGLKGKSVAAFCGIAQPEDFFRTLESAGANLVWQRALPDHFEYPEEAKNLIRQGIAESGAEWAVTTEKDIVKLTAEELSIPLKFLRMQIEFLEGEEQLVAQLLAAVTTPSTPVS